MITNDDGLITVRDIIITYLKEHDYDGLVNNDICVCDLEHLMICGTDTEKYHHLKTYNPRNCKPYIFLFGDIKYDDAKE